MRRRGITRDGRGPSRMMRKAFRLGLIGALCAFSVATAQGPGQPPVKVYFDTSHTADNLLRSAETQVKAGQFGEALEIYQRVISQFGDKVIDVPAEVLKPDGNPEFRLSVDAKRECQRRISILPPAAREIYRSRVDPQAERWFKQGAADRDKVLLRRVAEETFCSSWGDDALELLGDLSFQDGQFEEALASYRQLVPDRADDSLTLRHPDPTVDLPRVAAKKLLARAALGDVPGTVDLKSFNDAFPGAKANLANRKGDLSKIIEDAIREDHLATSSQPDSRWPTFGGSPRRTKVAPNAVDVGSLQWRVPLEPIAAYAAQRYGRFGGGGGFRGNYTSSVTAPAERMLGYHPIVIGDQVIVADEKSVFAYNLSDRPGDGNSLKVAWRAKNLTDGGGFSNRGSQGIARHTLTAVGDRIYVRLGPPNSVSFMRMNNASPSIIAAIDRAAEGKTLWKKAANEIALPRKRVDGGTNSAGFEGTPVADAKHVYVALTERVDMTRTYVACLSADTGAVEWVKYVCEANSNVDIFPGGGGPDVNQRLLTLDGPNLFYQTNIGALASLDTDTGAIRWLATYPWQGRNAMMATQDRDLNPAVVAEGLVIVAPDDTQSLFAFDVNSGRMVWKTEPLPDDVKLSHVLGVAKGNVIATGDRVMLFDVKTGKVVRLWPDSVGSATGFGRGILAGDRIYWPTKTEIHILDQATGLQVDQAIKLKVDHQTETGNLVVGDGYLIVARADELVVFCQNSRLIQRYREQLAKTPDDASLHFRLAQAAEATGDSVLALASYGRSLGKARLSEEIDGQPLLEATRQHQFRLLMKLAEKAQASKAWGESVKHFAAAADSASAPVERLQSRLKLSEAQGSDGHPEKAVATLQALLDDEAVRPLGITSPDGLREVRADLVIGDRLMSLIREHGRAVYASFDASAGRLLDQGKSEKSQRTLEEIGRRYPASTAVPEAWLALAVLKESEQKHAEASRAYKRLLATAASDPQRARGLWGLARSYESQKLWGVARDVYLQAATRYPEVAIEEFGTNARIGELVKERLTREPFRKITLDHAYPEIPTPLRRQADRTHSLAERLLLAEGIAPAPDSPRIFLSKKGTIEPLAGVIGAGKKVLAVEGDPSWVGYQGDRLIVATSAGVTAFGMGKGEPEWQLDLSRSAPPSPENDPFAKVAAEPPAESPGPPPALKRFRMAGNMILCLRGDRVLMAIDAESGQVAWSYTTKAEKFNELYWVGTRSVVIQAIKSNALLVIDLEKGIRRHEVAMPDGEPWLREPVALDEDRIALVPEIRTIALFEIARGKMAWTFQLSDQLPTSSAPRLLAEADHLLVLQNGNELSRVDVNTGRPIWTHLLGLESVCDRPNAFAMAADRVFCANGSELISLKLSDGKPAWRRPLVGPSSGWAVRLTERSVLAFPDPSFAQTETMPTLPVVVSRREDGRLLQRLAFSWMAEAREPKAGEMPLAVQLGGGGLTVVTESGLWTLGASPRNMESATPSR